ncbi:MAG: hypothetical protein QOE70_3807 [Chthoniobacter sp.]|jgi:hypothetical protein|nr:hypothetical protein [Chthoniobacter sp.]
MNTEFSKSGVKLFKNFRDNLIIDRYDPDFLRARESKLDKMRSENSEDAITWNVFRSLRQIDPQIWFPLLFESAFGIGVPQLPKRVSLDLWPQFRPPASLLAASIEEGKSEIDVVIATEEAVWFIEAKYKSDISKGTKHSPERNQIIRNIDVGSFHAGARAFYFSLLILDELHQPIGKSKLESYRSEPRNILEQVKHRTDGLANVKHLGLLTWAGLSSVLGKSSERATREDEKQYALRAIQWLKEKGITT